MLDRKSKQLVIDASVAGPRPSSTCHDFLLDVLHICHRAVITPEILEEWDKHQTPSSGRWRRQMVACKKWQPPKFKANMEIRDKARIAAAKEFDREKDRIAILKDLHLIDAAFASDGIVVSCDREAGRLFARLSQYVGELRDLVWVNPEEGDKNTAAWLEKGAEPVKSRRLGNMHIT